MDLKEQNVYGVLKHLKSDHSPGIRSVHRDVSYGVWNGLEPKLAGV